MRFYTSKQISVHSGVDIREVNRTCKFLNIDKSNISSLQYDRIVRILYMDRKFEELTIESEL